MYFFFLLVQHFPLDTKYISLFPQTPYRDEEVRRKQGEVSTLCTSSLFTFWGVGMGNKESEVVPSLCWVVLYSYCHWSTKFFLHYSFISGHVYNNNNNNNNKKKKKKK